MAQPKEKAGLLRWTYRIVVGLVALVAVIAGFLYVLSRSANSKWTQLTEAIRTRGEPLTYEEILAERPPIPEGENGAVTIQKAQEALDTVTGPDEKNVLRIGDECETDDRQAIARPCIEPTRAYLAARRTGLDELAAITSYDGVRFDIDYGKEPSRVISDYLPIASRLRALSKLVHVDGLLRNLDGDIDGMIASIDVQLHLSEPLYAEPTSILHSVATVIDFLATESVQVLLRSHELNAEQFARLERILQEHVQHVSPRTRLLGERAYFVTWTDEDRSLVLSHPPRIPFVSEWFAYGTAVEAILLFNPFIEAADDLPELLQVAEQAKSREASVWPTRDAVDILAPSLARAMELHAKVAARFQCIRLALAAERVRMTTGSFPEDSEALKAAFEGDWPIDPFSGDPLQYKKTETGAVVYSIDENRVDDGGAVQPAPGERREKDMGILLPNPDHRAVPIVDEPANDGEE